MNEVSVFGQSYDIFLARNEKIWFFDGGHFGLSNMATPLRIRSGSRQF